MKKILLTLAVIFTMALPVLASAQGLKNASDMLSKIGGASGEKIGVSGNLADSVATVIKTVLALVGTVFLVLTIYAGVMWMTAQGEESRVEKAMEILKAAVVGLVIIMSAYAITYFVTSKLTDVTTTSGQNSTQRGCCFRPTYAVCAPDTLESECNIAGGSLWTAGACSSNCP
ncbi:MAG: hypothetical protein A2534_00480 [Candidatus Magasanikbacteria bacterium RIFOXYD2_FULL_39_9]|uniref:Uncharacterized protein n=1 Tax=Candidatus Magasanikbacteria bacterium RIFOXYD1_FULL_40_23 TaxID=1798705 RepID=A0A1F6PA51_9BACT|nr:MAG: hypothetical protein A2534_00480 [Candidatus Magasanikbacteria bacterium RIFOXYD2_FULL_39_9]OGH93055.1 MAG: hypothetical protein A2563_04735 [Candidatus Magasanikbacteria bacterium RIFOXYD1_FULL_40_23]